MRHLASITGAAIGILLAALIVEAIRHVTPARQTASTSSHD